ncbi:hypothetical protein NBRC10512v2_006578 [Rhodotorula toruloides]
MAGGRASTRTSYKEADSDDDWLAGDEEGATKVFDDLPLVKGVKGKAGGAKGTQRVGDTYGAGPRKKARKSKSKGKEKVKEDEDELQETEKQPEPLFSLDLLLKLPNDLFLEAGSALPTTCGHIDTLGLLHLSRKCKTMRKMVFSPTMTGAWSVSRRRDEIPLPDGISELELVALMHGEGCQFCGSSERFHRDFFFRMRSCSRCRKQYVILDNRLRNAWPDLHPKAKRCVSYSDFDLHRYRPHKREEPAYLIEDLDEVNRELLELQDEDDLAPFAAAAVAASTNSYCRPSPPLMSQPKPKSLVDDFVALKQAEVAVRQKESHALQKGIDTKRQRDSEEWRAKRDGQREARKKLAADPVLVEKYGWTEEQVAFYVRQADLFGTSDKMPKTSPEINREGWDAYRVEVQASLERFAKATAEHRNYDALKPIYEQYCRSAGAFAQRLPNMGDLTELPVFKDWLKHDCPPFDEALWESRLPPIEQTLQKYAEELRMTAIKTILHATTGVSTLKLSKDPADYPENKYDEAFFARPTSLYFGTIRESDGVWGYTYRSASFAFPECLEHFHWIDWRPKQTQLRKQTNQRHVFFVRLILRAAELDDDTCTSSDLDDFGERFTWQDNAPKSAHGRLFGWNNLLSRLDSSGPTLRELEAGDVPNIKLLPLDDPRVKAAKRASGGAVDSSDEEDE